MENKKQIYVTKTLIKDKELSEIDFDFYNEIGHDYELTDFHIIEKKHGRADGYPLKIIEKKHGRADGYPLKIERLEAIIKEFKGKNVTHIEMNYHCDHIGYEFSGFNIRPSNEKEIAEFEAERKRIEDKKKKIDNLKTKIRKIENE